MINQKVTEEVFEKLFKSEDNKQCFECGAGSYKWASVNNGILLCLQCSGIHRGLGVNVSFVRSIDMDTWSEKQLNMMLQGGNAKLKAFFDSYNIPADAPLDFKFKTKAGIYYRDMLKCMVESIPVPEPPSQEEALELVDFSNPDFKMQTNQGSVGGLQQQQQQQEEEQKSDDPVEKAVQFFDSVFKKTKEQASIAYLKSQEAAEGVKLKAKEKLADPEFQQFKTKVSTGASELGEKASTGAKKGYEGFKSGLTSAWGFFQEKGKELQSKINKEDGQQQQQQEDSQNQNNQNNNNSEQQ